MPETREQEVYHSIERVREGRSVPKVGDDDSFEIVRILGYEDRLVGPGTNMERVYIVLAARDSATHRAPRRLTA